MQIKKSALLVILLSIISLPLICLGVTNHTKSFQDTSVTTVYAAIHHDAYKDFELENMDNVCERFSLENYNQLYRVAIDLVLMCKAFKAADFKVDLKLISSPNYTRSKRHVMTGVTHTAIDTLWSKDITTHDFYVTPPIIREGEFEKGIYTNPTHPLQSAFTNIDSLKNYSGVTFKNWDYDINIIKLLTPKIAYTSNFDSMTNMLYAGRVDFTLLEFPKKGNLDFTFNEKILKPIPGVKVIIQDSRSFVVTKNKEGSKKIYNALSKGITALHKSNQITDLYARYGFINKAVKNWETLNKKGSATQSRAVNKEGK